MNILVTGANGQLGNEMRIVSRQSADRYVFTDVADFPGNDTVHLDITDMEAVREAVSEYDIDIIVNCAAYTNVDKAEADIDACRLLNAKAPENLAVAIREKGGLLIHISTDYVFGGVVYDAPLNEAVMVQFYPIQYLLLIENQIYIDFLLYVLHQLVSIF